MKSIIENRFLELVKKPIKTKEEVAEMQKMRILFEQELKVEVRDLLSELEAIGTKYTDIWQLVNTKEIYPEIIDILIKYLPNPYHDKNKEGIIRALTVKEAKGKAVRPLIAEYERTPKEKDNLRWAIGNAIATTMTLNEVDWIISTVKDKSNGKSRGQLVLALGTVKSEEVEKALINLLNDEDVIPQTICALGRLKSKKAKEKIIELNSSSIPLIRLESQKALKKIG